MPSVDTNAEINQERLQKREKKLKIQFDLTAESEQELDELQRMSNSATRVETIRRALLFYGWLIHDVDASDTLQVINKNGDVVMAFPARLLKGTAKSE